MGPKTSSWARRASGLSPSTTVGVTNQPAPSPGLPPMAMRAPRPRTSSTASRTLARALEVITGPTTVPSSIGLPTVSRFTAATSASPTVPASRMPPTTITRLVAVHFWPA